METRSRTFDDLSPADDLAEELCNCWHTLLESERTVRARSRERNPSIISMTALVAVYDTEITGKQWGNGTNTFNNYENYVNVVFSWRDFG